jgi:hypothetical protein
MMVFWIVPIPWKTHLAIRPGVVVRSGGLVRI